MWVPTMNHFILLLALCFLGLSLGLLAKSLKELKETSKLCRIKSRPFVMTTMQRSSSTNGGSVVYRKKSPSSKKLSNDSKNGHPGNAKQ